MGDAHISSTSSIRDNFLDNPITNKPTTKRSKCLVVVKYIVYWILLIIYGVSMLYLEYKTKSSSDKELYTLCSIPVGISTIFVVLSAILSFCMKRKGINC